MSEGSYGSGSGEAQDKASEIQAKQQIEEQHAAEQAESISCYGQGESTETDQSQREEQSETSEEGEENKEESGESEELSEDIEDYAEEAVEEIMSGATEVLDQLGQKESLLSTSEVKKALDDLHTEIPSDPMQDLYEHMSVPPETDIDKEIIPSEYTEARSSKVADTRTEEDMRVDEKGNARSEDEMEEPAQKKDRNEVDESKNGKDDPYKDGWNIGEGWEWKDGTGEKWVDEIVKKLDSLIEQTESVRKEEPELGKTSDKPRRPKDTTDKIRTWGEVKVVDKDLDKPVKRKEPWEVMVKESEHERARKDVERLEKLRPELKGAKDSVYLLSVKEKLFVLDKDGNALGDVETIWRGTEGTDRPSTNLPEGTHVVDMETGKIYSAKTGRLEGEFVTRSDLERHGWRMSGNEVIKEKKYSIFLPPKERTPHRHEALMKVVKEAKERGKRFLVIRVPNEKDMMQREHTPGYDKVRAALERSEKYLPEGIKDMLYKMLKNPAETILSSLTGKVGTTLWSANLVKGFSEAYAIAKGAETRDEIDIAAQMFAKTTSDFVVGAGMSIASSAVKVGVEKSVEAVGRMRKGADLPKESVNIREGGDRLSEPKTETGKPIKDVPTEKEVPTQASMDSDTVVDIEFADTIPVPTEFADTIQAPRSRIEPPTGRHERLFEYYKDEYFEGKEAEASRSLSLAHEGDIKQAIKSEEFRRRLDSYLERHGPADRETIRRLDREVEKWFSDHFDSPEVKRGKEIISKIDVEKPGLKMSRGKNTPLRQHLYGDKEHARDFAKINGEEKTYERIVDKEKSLRTEFKDAELTELRDRDVGSVRDELAERLAKERLENEGIKPKELSKERLEAEINVEKERLENVERDRLVDMLAEKRANEKAFQEASRMFNELIVGLALDSLESPDTVLFKADFHKHPDFGGDKLGTQWNLEYNTKEGYRALITWQEDGQILNAFDVKREGTVVGQKRDGSPIRVPPPTHTFRNREFIVGNDEKWISMRQKVSSDAKINSK